MTLRQLLNRAWIRGRIKTKQNVVIEKTATQIKSESLTRCYSPIITIKNTGKICWQLSAKIWSETRKKKKSARARFFIKKKERRLRLYTTSHQLQLCGPWRGKFCGACKQTKKKYIFVNNLFVFLERHLNILRTVTNGCASGQSLRLGLLPKTIVENADQ